MRRRTLPLFSLLLCGCVSAGRFDAKAAELSRLRAAAVDREKALLGRIGALEKQTDEQARRLRDEEQRRARLAKQLDDGAALIGELRERLHHLGQDVLPTSDALEDSLRDAQERLEDLRRQQAAQEASARARRALAEQLQALLDAGQAEVSVRDGHTHIALPDEVLFEPGRAQLKTAGAAALGKVAQALRALPARRFLVAGHTDDLPASGGFPSNWDLSAVRAVEVTKQLIGEGVRPQALAAAGYGEFDPLYPNDSPEHRARNRRIEILVLPEPDLPRLEAAR